MVEEKGMKDVEVIIRFPITPSIVPLDRFLLVDKNLLLSPILVLWLTVKGGPQGIIQRINL